MLRPKRDFHEMTHVTVSSRFLFFWLMVLLQAYSCEKTYLASFPLCFDDVNYGTGCVVPSTSVNLLSPINPCQCLGCVGNEV
jgi:hypothetical protein